MIIVIHRKQKSHGLKLRVQRGMIHPSPKSEQRNTNLIEWKIGMAVQNRRRISTLQILYVTAIRDCLQEGYELNWLYI